MTYRLRLAAAVALFVTVAAPIATAQQDPNAPATKGARGQGGPGGPGGGPGGPGGPGGFGGRGGPGGPGGNSVERLVTNDAVQEDMKVTEKQKTQIKALTEQVAKKRTQFQANLPKLIDAANAAANAAAVEAAAANGIILDPNAGNGNNGNNGRGGRGGNNNNGGPGGNNAGRQVARQATTDFQNGVDAAYLKLLDAKQKTRIKQITLQAEGTRAFTTPNPEVVEKLAITEEQFAEIKAVTGDLQQTQRASMRQVMASIAPPADPNAPAANNNNNNNNGGGGGNNGGGNNQGGRAGRGGFPNMANMDEATRTKFFQTMNDVRTKQTSETMAAIGKILTKAQKATYGKMVGEAFDLAKLRGPGGPGGPPGAPAATASTAATAPTTATPKAATAAPTPKAATTAATKTAASKTKSLRQSRDDN